MGIRLRRVFDIIQYNIDRLFVATKSGEYYSAQFHHSMDSSDDMRETSEIVNRSFVDSGSLPCLNTYFLDEEVSSFTNVLQLHP